MRTFSPTLALGAILLTSFSSTSLLAQEQQPAAAATQAVPAPAQARHIANPQRHARKMAKKLGLTPDQESKLEPILADKQQQMATVKADTTLPPKDKHAKVRSINQDSDAKVESILNEAQRQQYEQMKQSRKANKQQRSGASTNS
jgi:Spy/CpxP family protein refolding chaperone